MGSETTKTPSAVSTLQACSFFSNPFLEFCLLTPAFFPSTCSTCLSTRLTHWKFQSIAWEPKILWKKWFAWQPGHFARTLTSSCYAIFTWNWTYKTHDLTDYHMFVHAFDTLKIPEHCFGTWPKILWKRWFAWAFCKNFLLLCNFHMNHLNIRNSWPNWLSTYSWQFSTDNHFHVKWSTNPRVTSILPTAIISLCALTCHCTPWSISIALLSLEISTLIFCVLIWPQQIVTNHFIQFVFESLLHSRMIHPGNCCPVPSTVGFNSPISSQSLLHKFLCANLPHRFVFKTLVCTHMFHP